MTPQEMAEVLDDIEQMLTIPAAEYVPAIGDVFVRIAAARRALRTTQPPAPPTTNP